MYKCHQFSIITGHKFIMLIIIYLIALSVVTSVLQIFFRGSCAYCHILEILKFIGFKKHNKDFWNYDQQISSISIPLEIRNFTFDNAIDFISQKNYWLGQLLSCPYCLSWHLSFWSIIIINIGTYTLYSFLCPFWLDILMQFSIPYISNLLLQRLD